MYNIVITRVKNEQGYIESFVYHYLYLGFDFIYILINEDQNYVIENEKVKIIKHNFLGDEVISKFFKTFLQSLKKIDWVLHVDVDEYLFLSNKMNIKNYIDKFATENTGQFLFKWAIIENYRSVLGQEYDLQIILDKSKIFSNKHYKSIFKLINLLEITNPHFVVVNNDTYLDNTKITNKLEGHIENDFSYDTSVLIHFHTRSLENVFIKSLTYDFNNMKEKIPNILQQNLSLDELIKNVTKLKMPFDHAKDIKLDKKKLQYLKFNIDTTINKKIIYKKFISVCKKKNIEFRKIKKYIKLLENKYAHIFVE